MNWTTLLRSCLKGDVEVQAWYGVAKRGMCVCRPNEGRDSAIRLEACVLGNDGHFEHRIRVANCDTNSSN